MDKNTQENEIVEENVLQEEENKEEIAISTEPMPVNEIKKSLQAKALVEEAKSIVEVCNAQSKSCKRLLESDLHEYENAQSSLNTGGLEECISLLEQLGYADFMSHKNTKEKVLVFEIEEKIPSLEIKSIQTGRFTAVLYGILGAIILAIALIYLATEQLGMTLDITHLPSSQMIEDIASWFAVAFGLEKNFYIGLGIFIALSLGMMLVIYRIRVYIRSNYNLVFAQKQLEEAQAYQTAQGLCKWEMSRVEEHMRDTLVTLKLYEVIFREQKMKLERIIYIEGVKTQENEYHSKSLIEIQETKTLIEVIQDFMSFPMSDEGRLAEASVKYLEEAKLSMNKVLNRFYD